MAWTEADVPHTFLCSKMHQCLLSLLPSQALHGCRTRATLHTGTQLPTRLPPQDSSQHPRDTHVPCTLGCTVPSPVLTTGFCGDRASMWLPLTVMYCCTEGCTAPAAGTATCCGSSPGSCLIITWARQQTGTREENTFEALAFQPLCFSNPVLR